MRQAATRYLHQRRRSRVTTYAGTGRLGFGKEGGRKRGPQFSRLPHMSVTAVHSNSRLDSMLDGDIFVGNVADGIFEVALVSS